MAIKADTFELTDETCDSAIDSLLRKAARVSDVPVRPPLPQLGAIIGDKYRVQAQLGRGGMGAVFRAIHIVSEKPVALKWMLHATSNGQGYRRFLREARAAGRIDHPNVVDVYDVGEEGACCYLVMELLHGESLRARLKRGSLAPAQAAELLLPAMRGVAAVHQAKVIHRDLKPDNIFLCEGPDGMPREAKVLDFGISAVNACEPADPTLTADGQLLGTPAYMSPEQLQSSRDLDATTDVYSFGVILYEALTGEMPFKADSYSGLVLAIAQGRPVAPRELCPSLPESLQRVILRALAKRREDRYQSIEALIDAVTDALSDMRDRQVPLRSQRLTAFSAAGCLALAIAAPLMDLVGTKQVASVPDAIDVQPSAAPNPSVAALHLASASALVSAEPLEISLANMSQPRVPPPVSPPSPQPETDAATYHPVSDARRELTKRRMSPVDKPADARPAVPASPAGACDPPYSIDATGHRLFRVECL